MRFLALAGIVSIVLVARPVRAEIVSVFESESPPPRNYANLRAGVGSGTRHPMVCLEIAPLPFLAIDQCGTGSGFLHHDPDPELAHFKAKLGWLAWKGDWGWIEPRLSAGFSELQVGEDSEGFHFNDTGPTGVETAGPEVGASVRGRTSLESGVDLILELDVNGAWMPHAPELVRPRAKFQPSGFFTFGLGF